MSCSAIGECPVYIAASLMYHTGRDISATFSTECKMGPNRSKICPFELETSKLYGIGLQGFLAVATMCFDRWRKRPMRSDTKKTESFPERGVTFIINMPQWEHVSGGYREVRLREYPDIARQIQSKGRSVDNRASPCEHERRGHIRTLRDGRKINVRPSIVNKGGEKVVYRIEK